MPDSRWLGITPAHQLLAALSRPRSHSLASQDDLKQWGQRVHSLPYVRDGRATKSLIHPSDRSEVFREYTSIRRKVERMLGFSATRSFFAQDERSEVDADK